MNSGEARFWNFLRPRLKKYGHFERIESHDTAVGTPDVNYCINGYNNHLELKHTASIKRGFRLRASQAGWFKARVKAGGQPWLLAMVEDPRRRRGYILIPGADVPGLAKTTSVQNWLNKAVMVWEKEILIDQLVQFLGTYLMVDAAPPDSKDQILIPKEKELILPSGTRSVTKPSS